MHRTGKGFSVAAALAALAVATATPAAAAPAVSDRDAYLGPLLTKYASLQSDELLTEAAKICAVADTGQAASATVPMVEHDLQITVSAAIDVIAGAVEYLNC